MPNVHRQQRVQQTQSNGGSSATQRFIDVAKAQQGKPYVFGAQGPNAFDCSGLVYYALHQAGVPGGRTTADGYMQRYHNSAVTNIHDLKPGDLVFYHYGNDRGIGEGHASHIEIFLGYKNGVPMTMGTDTSSEPARIEPMDTKAFIGGARVPELNGGVATGITANDTVYSGSSGSGGGNSGGGGSTSTSSSASTRSSSSGTTAPSSAFSDTEIATFLMQLMALLNSGDSGSDQAALELLATQYPGVPKAQLMQIVALLQANPELRKKVQKDPKLLEHLTKSPAEVKRLLDDAKPAPGTRDAFAASRSAPVSMLSQAEPLRVDPSTIDPALVQDVQAQMRGTIAV